MLASVSPDHPVLNNAVLLDPAAVDEVRALFADAGPYAVWSREPVTARALAEQGFRTSKVTHAMVCRLDVREQGPDPSVLVRRDAPVEAIASLNHVEPALLTGVPCARAYVTDAMESGALLLAAGSDVNVSFVATVPERRRRGLAGAVLEVALQDAQRDGFLTSSLQATPTARRLYLRLGYRDVGTWQEWTAAPATRSVDRSPGPAR